MAKKAKTVRYAVLPDGSRREITGENGRYYVCGDAQFRKAAVLTETEKIEPDGDKNDTGKAKK